MKKSERIKAAARELGFELVGITPSAPPPDYDLFRWWLDQGYAGTMAYLKRGSEKRGDPEKILPGVKSVICCGLNYYTGHAAGAISSYAWGKDYHDVVAAKLKELERFIQRETAPPPKTKCYVDTGPILERSYAAGAGLGWIGKNTCLIHNGLGSYLFLGEILTTLEFGESEYDRPALDQCGSCTKCLEACPTGALVESGVLDSNRCISYLTIEYRDEFNPEQEAMVKGHFYGCDICQQVCPYNERIPITPLTDFQPRQGLVSSQLGEIESWSEEDFVKRTRDMALNRIGWGEWLRNLRVWRQGGHGYPPAQEKGRSG